MEINREEAMAFYKEALNYLNESGTNYILGGGFSLFHHTGIYRDTKDLDIFCKHSEYPKIMKLFESKGYRVEMYDVRWLAKVHKGDFFIDIIFDSVNNICTVTDDWYDHAVDGEFAGIKVKMLAAEELIWCKSYVINRERFDGADINHILLKQGKNLNWKRLLSRYERHWHLLLSHLILFQFVYPSEYRDIIPKWVFDDLIQRANDQYDLPPQVEKVCRGPIIDNTQYEVDVKQWDYKAYTIKTV
jgi:predicted nucleotidyltransferase